MLAYDWKAANVVYPFEIGMSGRLLLASVAARTLYVGGSTQGGERSLLDVAPGRLLDRDR
jgi:hypothetical protein